MYSGLGEGQHTFEVRAKDSAGTTDPTPAKRTWTVDTTAPTVSNTTPADGAGSVAPSDNVTATFSEAIDSATLTTSTFTLDKVGTDGTTTTPVSAAVTLSSDGKTATLDPSANLEPSTNYTVTVTTGVKDKAGNALDQDPNATDNQSKTWSFRTTGC